MLSIRQNLLETIQGGKPDRYVNQFEFFPFIMCAPLTDFSLDEDGCMCDEWGVTQQVAGQPGAFPLQDDEHLVVKDVEDWKDYVKVPDYSPKELWEPLAKQVAEVNTDEVFSAVALMPGVFERYHDLCGLTDGLMAFYECPDEAKGLLECITDVELTIAENVCKYVKPELVFHHDDWGTQNSTFMNMDMFREFIKPCYEQIYGYYKSHGVKIIVHHSDSFGETLVPEMIDLGIDIWQGVLKNANDIPKLIDEYGGQISFMGAIEDQEVDVADWTEDGVKKIVRESIDIVGPRNYFIPCITQGAPASLYDGVYDVVTKTIAEKSKEDF